MYLSMWIIEKGLRKFGTEAHIQDGDMIIRNASLLSDTIKTRPHTIYVCVSEDFIPSLKNKIICINRKDYIIVESNDLPEMLDAVEQLIDFYMEWDLQVREGIDRCYTLQDVVSEAAPVFQRVVCVANSGFIYLAASGLEYCKVPDEWLKYVRTGEGMPLLYSLQFLKAAQQNYHQETPYFSYYDLMHCGGMAQNLKEGDRLWGYAALGMNPGDQPEKADFQLLSVFAHQVNYWKRRSGDHTEIPGQEKIIRSLIHKNGLYSAEETDQFFQRLSWRKTDEKYVCLLSELKPEGFYYKRLKYMIAQIYPECINLQDNHRQLLVINASQRNVRELAAALQTLFEKTDTCIGFSYPFTDWMQLTSAIRQAETAVEMISNQGGGTPGVLQRFFLAHVRSLMAENLGEDFVHPRIRELLQYDQKHFTPYCETLKIFLQNERSLVRTAKAMNIHVNTLKYRLKRIQEVLKLSLDDDQIRDNLRISLILLECSYPAKFPNKH